MKKINIFANWKMYLDYDESNILANALLEKAKDLPENIQITLFPSALALYPIVQTFSGDNLAVGAQNAYWIEKGGYTGEISMQMYKDAGCKFILIGHSERRHIFNETNHEVRQKIEAALSLGLTPVICVGETQEERKSNKTEEVVEVQLRAAFDGLTVAEGTEIFVAYEPVWAIGTGEACAAGEAERMHAIIDRIVKALIPNAKLSILYGGSVRADIVADYLVGPATDGVLVGNASAKLESISDIIDRVIAVATAK